MHGAGGQTTQMVAGPPPHALAATETQQQPTLWVRPLLRLLLEVYRRYIYYTHGCLVDDVRVSAGTQCACRLLLEVYSRCIYYIYGCLIYIVV